MKRIASALLLVFGLAGCNAFGIFGEDENEVRVTITELGSASDYLVADDGHRYEVTAETEYEGLTGFADLAIGDVVEIEYEKISNSSNRRALEIEGGDYDDDNPDD
ncbi:MAG TPA: DUF5666 domain-containing protein [Longimicrobiales bacterium]|nr:DUF5666 domain-containing protein [Longimicrobiales bacterium]